jgi:hypothetical protein
MAFMPLIGSRPEGPKYGKENYFGYSGWHKVHMTSSPSPPFPAAPVESPAKVSTAVAEKFICYIAFIFELIKLLYKLIPQKI